MKTKILLLGFLLSVTYYSFGQTNWGNWIPDKCFSFIQYQMKVDDIVENSNQCGERQTNYSVKIRNTSSKSVYIEHAIYTANNRQIWVCEQGQVKLIFRQDAAYFNEIKPNETITVKYSYIRGGDQLFFEVWSLKTIANDGKWSECYQKCDNGQSCYKCQLKPDLGNCCNSTTVSEHDRIYGTNTTNQNTTQSNQQRQQQENQRIAEENQRRAEEEKQKKLQAKQELINISINATTDLINDFANRKNALRNSLDQEDAQALLAIVNSENPTNYTQNIIQIFTDLGYTYRETENKNGITTITMNNDVKNINDFLNINITIPSYDNYNRISFSYHRKEKLLEQLAILGNKLEGYKRPEIKGVPPSRIEKVNTEIEKIEQETKNKEV